VGSKPDVVDGLPLVPLLPDQRFHEPCVGVVVFPEAFLLLCLPVDWVLFLNVRIRYKELLPPAGFDAIKLRDVFSPARTQDRKFCNTDLSSIAMHANIFFFDASFHLVREDRFVVISKRVWSKVAFEDLLLPNRLCIAVSDEKTIL
jgi:hypothetical protein